MGQENTLFDDVMQGRWERVVTAYADPETQKSRITTSEDTALHIAILNGQTEIVRQLVEQIHDEHAAAVLMLQNVRGSTAIHLAAAVGDADMCGSVAYKAPAEVIGISNGEGETPLFLAAMSGKTWNFFLLLDRLEEEKADEICHRRSCKGDTILHAAISGEHFGNKCTHIKHFHMQESNVDDPESFRKETIQGAGFGRRVNLKEVFPPNYATIIDFFKLVLMTLLLILGFGHARVTKIKRMKSAHTWANIVLKTLVDSASLYRYENSGRKPTNGDIDPAQIPEFPTEDQHSQNSVINTNEPETGEKAILVATHMGITDMVDKFMKASPAVNRELDMENENLVLVSYKKENLPHLGSVSKETPILIAAKMGVKEVVQKILETFPIAIHDQDIDNKNVVLLAVENKHVQVFKLLTEKVILKESVFGQVDKDGNSALHLAATFGDSRPWLIPGAGLQMQWELKWYKFVKQSMPPNFFRQYNKRNHTPKQILLETHKQLAKSGSEWLTKTSESCSVVAALVATVAFAGSSTVPGGNKEDTGTPVLEQEPAFNIFAITSLVALCLSVTSLVTFLTILTSRFDHKDFAKSLPRKLIWGLTSLFLSIASMLVSFCAAHFFVLKDSLRMFSYPVYAATCLPVTIFLLSTFSLYYDLICAIYSKEPQHSLKEFHP
ncbi:unnamed protein product [Linum tenue]|uniref:PGG domain-containing protein n=1 Tax=Linum tenue TaxID=586396 RepID=A0AAV0H350_9ROSI|nr:unnamed protein product [Linum tenue]